MLHKFHGIGLLIGAGVSALALGLSPTHASAAVAEDDSGVIEEIVVTSRRRAETQQDVPGCRCRPGLIGACIARAIPDRDMTS